MYRNRSRREKNEVVRICLSSPRESCRHQPWTRRERERERESCMRRRESTERDFECVEEEEEEEEEVSLIRK